MPLYVLLILVAGGIALIALLLHLLGKSRRTILSEASARAAWTRHFPGEIARDVTLSQDRHAALITGENGPGLLWAFGADTVARHLQNFDLKPGPDHLTVVFHDFTAPRVALRLSKAERALWPKRMTPK